DQRSAAPQPPSVRRENARGPLEKVSPLEAPLDATEPNSIGYSPVARRRVRPFVFALRAPRAQVWPRPSTPPSAQIQSEDSSDSFLHPSLGLTHSLSLSRSHVPAIGGLTTPTAVTRRRARTRLGCARRAGLEYRRRSPT